MEKNELSLGKEINLPKTRHSEEVLQALSIEGLVEKLEQGEISFEDVRNLDIRDRIALVRDIADQKGWELQQVIEDAIWGKGDKYFDVLEIFVPDLLQQFYEYIGKIIDAILVKDVDSLNYIKDELILFYENFLRRFEIVSVSIPLWIKRLEKTLLVLKFLEEEEVVKYKIALREVWNRIKSGELNMEVLRNFLEKYTFLARISFWKLSHVVDGLSYEEQVSLVRILVGTVERFVLYGEESGRFNSVSRFVIGIDLGKSEEVIRVPLSVNEKFQIVSNMSSIIFDIVKGKPLGEALNREIVEKYVDIIIKVIRDVDKLDPLFSFQGVFEIIKRAINFFSPELIEKVIEKFYLRLQLSGVYIVDFHELNAFKELLVFLKRNRVFGKSVDVLPLYLLKNLRKLLEDMEFFISTLMGDDIKGQYSKVRAVIIEILNLLSYEQD